MNDFLRKTRSRRKRRKEKRKLETIESSTEEHDLSHLVPEKQQRYGWYRAGPVNYLIGSSKMKLENKMRNKLDQRSEVFQENDFISELRHQGKLKALRELTMKKRRNRKTKTRKKKNDRKGGTSGKSLRISEPIVLRTDTEKIKNFFNRGIMKVE